MIYFTSDLHLGHANIIKLCDRPFSVVEEMDEALIANWNARVTNADTVYIVGDLIFRNEKPAEEYLRCLKGRKRLIVGNHDRKWMGETDLPRFFESVDALLEIDACGKHVTLCHYPMMSWPNGGKKSSLHVHGHIHNNRGGAYWPLLRTMDRALNACIEVNGYMPVTLDELVANNAAFRSGEDV